MDHINFRQPRTYPRNNGRLLSPRNVTPFPVSRPAYHRAGPLAFPLWRSPPQTQQRNYRPVLNGNVAVSAGNIKAQPKNRDSSCQTDFPKEIADLHLKELPNSLFIEKNLVSHDQGLNHKSSDTVQNHTTTDTSSVKNFTSSGTHPLSKTPRNSHVEPISPKNDFSDIESSQPNKPAETSENETRPEEAKGTKKKRKRNRKKKKGGSQSVVEEDQKSNTLESSQVEEERVELIRLEDESEFPDLSGHRRTNSSGGISIGSIIREDHLDVLKTENGDNSVSDTGLVFDSEGNDQQIMFSTVTETKSARKRRKRRDQANKAANEEMAEITIEQQMLQELGLKAKRDGTSTAKEPPTPPSANTNKAKGGKNNRKSNQPIALDFAAMIDALEQRRDDAITTKNAPKKPMIRRKPKPELDPPKRPHNPLDSTCPTVKRGKEREFPKPKKPSPLKKVILKEREEKKRLRLLDEDHGVGGGGTEVCVGVVNPESDLSQDEDRTKGSASADLSPVSQTSPFSMSPLSPSTSPLQSGFNSPIAKDAQNPALMKIHSRRYREYCTQILDKDIDNCCLQFLQNLVRYQDKQYHKDPKKAKAKRRIVLGLREVTKHLKLKKIKCVIISPNLEKIQSKGGLDDALNNILNMCTEQEVPYVFALGRRALGRACAKLVPVSVVGVFNFEGSEKQFWRLIELTQKATDSYKEMVSVVEKDLQENPASRACPSNVPSLFAHMGHSRTPSGCSAISFTSSILSEPISENYPHSEPETDSKGYEVAKHGRSQGKGIQSSVINEQTSAYETDAGNEADTEDYLEPVETEKKILPFTNGVCADTEEDEEDNIEDLPHIDSIHHGNYDLSMEILSQHSSRTIENSEAMSTHSSRTLRDGSPTLLLDKISDKQALGSMSTPHKIIDKDRIQSWVEATQSVTEDVQGSAPENGSTDSEREQTDSMCGGEEIGVIS